MTFGDWLEQFVRGIECTLRGGHDWEGDSHYTTDRPGYLYRTRLRCRHCYRTGPWRYVTEEEARRNIEDSFEAYHKGSPWLEVRRMNPDGTTQPDLVANPDYDPDWKPRTRAEEFAANYIAEGALGRGE